MRNVELYLMHNAQFIMHNYEASYNWFPCKFKLPSLGGVGGDYASQLSSHREGSGEITQVRFPLLGRGRGRLRKLALPSLGEGSGVGFCYFLLQMLSQEGACWEAKALRSEIREFWAYLQHIDYEYVMKNEARYSVKSWQKTLQSASYQRPKWGKTHAEMTQMSL